MIYLSYIMTLDGKIGDVESNFFSFASREDRKKLFFLRAMADVVVVGAKTVRVENPPFKVSGEFYKLRKELGKNKEFDLVIISKSLNFPERCRAFEELNRNVYILTDSGSDKENIPGVSVVELDISGRKIFDFLREKGYVDILVEGGGEVNSIFLREDLVDKIYVTISPIVLCGRENPTPCGGKFMESFPEFQLVDIKRVVNELFLEYERIR